MSLLTCEICNRNKTALRCDSCRDVSCKSCVHFIDEDHFEFIPLLPEDLRNKTFCMNCYNQGIDARITHFQDIAMKAKKVDIYTIKQTKETRLYKRKEAPVKVIDCEDREETLLRLAFIAAEKGYDTVVDVDIRSKKIGEGKSYKKLIWSGTGVPVNPVVKK